MRAGAVSVTEAAEPEWVVYHLFSSTGELLYVGMTGEFKHRLAAHRRGEFGSEIASVRLEHFPNREEAAEHEALAIKRLRPQYNVRLNLDGPRLAGTLVKGRLVSCRFCGAPTLIWARGRLGKPYLIVAEFPAEDGSGMGYRTAFHRCEVPARI